jgi:hypothetical protein
MSFYYRGEELTLPLDDDVREMLLNRGKDPLVAACDRAWANIKQNQELIQGSAEEETEDESEGSYSDLTRAELVAEVEARNKEIEDNSYDDELLSTSGNKGELIARLEAFDERHPDESAD